MFLFDCVYFHHGQIIMLVDGKFSFILCRILSRIGSRWVFSHLDASFGVNPLISVHMGMGQNLVPL